jgi:anti-anti-sigma factor
MIASCVTVELERARAYAVVRPHGELDLTGLDALAGAIAEAQRENWRVVVDLSELEFMDSSCLLALAQAHDRALADGRRFHLVPGRPSVQAVFHLTGTQERFRWISREQLA